MNAVRNLYGSVAVFEQRKFWKETFFNDKAEKIIYPLADKLGITKKRLSSENIDIDFIFSKNKLQTAISTLLSSKFRIKVSYMFFSM